MFYSVLLYSVLYISKFKRIVVMKSNHLKSMNNGVYKTHSNNGVYKTHSIGQALQKTLAKKLSKEEYLTIKLICDWHLIAPKIHQISKPLRVYLDQEMLVLATQPGYSMTLQYQNDEICWSVNKYLNSQQITRLLIKTDFYYNK